MVAGPRPRPGAARDGWLTRSPKDRSRFQRDCIRQAGIGLGAAIARTGPPDPSLFTFDRRLPDTGGMGKTGIQSLLPSAPGRAGAAGAPIGRASMPGDVGWD
jgi:hypothetical protein